MSEEKQSQPAQDNRTVEAAQQKPAELTRFSEAAKGVLLQPTGSQDTNPFHPVSQSPNVIVATAPNNQPVSSQPTIETQPTQQPAQPASVEQPKSDKG